MLAVVLGAIIGTFVVPKTWQALVLTAVAFAAMFGVR